MAIARESNSPAGEHEDAAWLRIATALPADDLRAFLDDVERLYRINPLLDISKFEASRQSRDRLVAHNHSNGSKIEVLLAVTATDRGRDVAYSRGLKVATNCRVEAARRGSHLFVTDVYGGCAGEERRLRS